MTCSPTQPYPTTNHHPCPIARYFELFVMFDRMDDDNDRRLSEEEFVTHAKNLQTWGVKSKDLRGSCYTLRPALASPSFPGPDLPPPRSPADVSLQGISARWTPTTVARCCLMSSATGPFPRAWTLRTTTTPRDAPCRHTDRNSTCGLQQVVAEGH